MTGRYVFIALLSVGCAAAVPAAHGYFGGDPAGHHLSPHDGATLHGALQHGAPGESMPSADAIRAHVDAALDGLGLEPATRAKAKAILEPHVAKAIALHEKAASGELQPDAAMAEHEQILAAAESDLASVLTQEQIEQFVDMLFPQHAATRGE